MSFKGFRGRILAVGVQALRSNPIFQKEWLKNGTILELSYILPKLPTFL